MSICVGCRKDQIDSTCGICGGALCRKCKVYLADDEFLLDGERPDTLKHTYYCGPCNNEIVEPYRDTYNTTFEAAKDINVFFKESKSTIRVKRKAVRAIRVTGSNDRDETLMKLAFQAARGGYNALIEVELTSEKKRNQGWHTSVWTGSGIPAEIQSHRLSQDLD